MISISYVMCMIYVTMLFVSVAHGPVGLLRNKLLTYLHYIAYKLKLSMRKRVDYLMLVSFPIVISTDSDFHH